MREEEGRGEEREEGRGGRREEEGRGRREESTSCFAKHIVSTCPVVNSIPDNSNIPRCSAICSTFSQMGFHKTASV